MWLVPCTTLQGVEPDDYLRHLRHQSSALVEAVRLRPDQVVPSCPAWTTGDLLGHVGNVWGWAAAIVRSGARAEFPTDPVSPDEATERAGQLVAALEAADPDANCWTFGLPRSNRFWFRRQTLETAVHARDVQEPPGPPLDPELAADGIDEFLTLWLPRRQLEGWAGRTLHLHRTDGQGEWLIRFDAGGAAASEQAHGKGDVALRGSASALYLWILNRVPTDALEVFGDRDLAGRWSADITF